MANNRGLDCKCASCGARSAPRGAYENRWEQVDVEGGGSIWICYRCILKIREQKLKMKGIETND